MDIIAKEIDYYKSNRLEFIEQYAGKYLVIKGMSVIGVYNTYSAAFEDTLRNHERDTFIIEHPMAVKIKKAV
jgi:hypothetical protein